MREKPVNAGWPHYGAFCMMRTSLSPANPPPAIITLVFFIRRSSLLTTVNAVLVRYESLHLCETAIDKQFRSGDVAAVVGCEKRNSLSDLIGCAEPT
jgi:hypothetical protein